MLQIYLNATIDRKFSGFIADGLLRAFSLHPCHIESVLQQKGCHCFRTLLGKRLVQLLRSEFTGVSCYRQWVFLCNPAALQAGENLSGGSKW